MKYRKIVDSIYIKGRIGWKGLKKKEYLKNSNYRIINGSNIVNGGVDWDSCGYISKERYLESPEIALEDNDILITKDGTIGKVGIVKKLNTPSTVASGIFVIRNEKENQWDTLFLYYFFQSFKFNEFIHARQEGSVIPHLYQKDFQELMIPEISIEKQKSISRKLETLQKSIDLNKKINTNLEILMDEIFKKQVLNSEDCGENVLGKIATFKNGLAMKKYRASNDEKTLSVLKIRELHQGFTDDSSDKCTENLSQDVVINTGDIVFSWSGTLLVKIWPGDKCGLNQHLFKVSSDNYPNWFIYEWTKHYLKHFQNIAADKATTMGHIKRSDLNEAIVKIPQETKMNFLNDIINPLYSSYLRNIYINNALEKAKDLLMYELFDEIS